MAKTREWLFNTSTGMPVRITLNKNRLVSVNGSPETKVMALKAPESNFAERVFNIRFWVDSSVVSIGDNGTYTADEYSNLHYSARVKVEIKLNK